MMVDKRPIGIFDSGLGGLTAVKEVLSRMPEEDIVFFGDTGRVPYGNKSAPTVISYALQDLSFLLRFDIKAAVVACGTVSSVAIPELRKGCSVPVYGVVEAAVEAALKQTVNKRIGVIATASSIRSGTYERLLSARMPDALCFPEACPLLVPLVENGRFSPDDPVVELVLREYLEPLLKKNIDTLILGCTHYPILEGAISRICEGKVRLINPGKEVAEVLCAELYPGEPEEKSGTPGTLRLFVSDDPEGFAQNGGLFLGRDITSQVSLCDIGIFNK